MSADRPRTLPKFALVALCLSPLILRAPYSVWSSLNVSGNAASAGRSPSNPLNSLMASGLPNTTAGLKKNAVLKTGPYFSTRVLMNLFGSFRYANVSLCAR